LIYLQIGSKGLFQKGNRFWGSLAALKNCTKLEKLHIQNTDINQGLEYLSESLESLMLLSFYLPNSNFKVRELEKILSPYGEDSYGN
jgi:hypothetical protein